MKIIEKFADEVIASGAYKELDRVYVINKIKALVGDEDQEYDGKQSPVKQLVQIAVDRKIIPDDNTSREVLNDKLYDLKTPTPSKVNEIFWQKMQKSANAATDWFYKLCVDNNYVKKEAIAKNIVFSGKSSKNHELEITINLSKPEKDPKAIAAAKNAVASDYPKCQLCMENEGYLGRINHPARSNHRVVRFQMEDKEWGFQYSPYAYFNEHSIFFYGKHEPMHISPLTFGRLLTIVEAFPGYFAGSNADLPIVGGSILTHEHYQGGRHTFPMEVAGIKEKVSFDGYSDIETGIVNWPMSVLRLRSEDKERLIALATKILNCWRGYSDEKAGVLAESDGQPHHTITPIARRKDGKFELDLVLRDNQTSEEHPDGIYHPHKDVQHIKKENIGLIEVMGLAILPPRLKTELKDVEDYLLGQGNQVAPIHQEWADELKAQNTNVTAEEVTEVVRQSVADIFARVLEDAGVYKTNSEGLDQFKAFVYFVNLAD